MTLGKTHLSTFIVQVFQEKELESVEFFSEDGLQKVFISDTGKTRLCIFIVEVSQ